MSIVASQVVGRVAIEGADRGKQQLNEVGQASDKTQRELNLLKPASEQASGGLFNLASKAGMAIFGIKQIAESAVGLVGSLIAPAISAEQMGIAFDTLTGSAEAAKKIIKELSHFADVTPFEPGPVQEYAAQLIGMQIDAQKVIPIMTSLGDALYGIGHGTEAEMKSVVDIIGKISIQGKLTGGDLTQLGEHGIDAAGAIAAAMGKTREEILAMAGSEGGLKAKEAIDALTKGIEMNPLYQGGMAKQANSLAGIMSTLSGYTKSAVNAFLGLQDGHVVAGSLFDMLKKGIADVSTLVQNPAFQNFATGAGQAVARVFGEIGDIVKNDVVPAFAFIQLSIQSAEPQFQRIASLLTGQFNRALKDVGDVARQLGGWFRSDVVPALKSAEPGFTSLGHVIFDQLVPALFQLRGIAIEVAEHAIAKFGPLVEKIVPPLIRFAGILAKDIAEGLKFIMPYALSAASAIGKFASEIIDRVAPIAEKWFSDLSVALKIFGQMWANAWPMISQILKGAWDIIVGIIQVAWALVTGIIKIGLDILFGNWAQAWQDVKDMLAGVWAGILSILSGAWEFIKVIFSPVVRWFSDIWQGVVDAFHNILSGLGGIAQNIWSGVVGAVKWGINQVIDLIDGIISHVNDISGTIGIHIDPIAHLASGTDFFPGGLAMYGEGGEPEIVTRPTVGYLPRGTRVTPMSQLSQMSGGSSGSGPITVILEVNRHQLGKVILPLVTDNVRLHTGVRF